jgi:CheY-like chemotaxis protein
VLVATRRRGGNLRIEVHDTGIGIPEDRFDDIFVEFQQLGNPQRDRSQGLGLGLAIVNRLAVLLGHSIELRSKPGHGSCFAVSVPLLQEQPPMNHVMPMTRQMLGNELLDCRVLLLDDDIAVRESMQSLLEHWGCRVYLAASIEEVESLSGTHTPDILIVDYRLPGSLTGLDAVGRLRNYLGNESPALIITGDTAPQRLREAQDSGLPLLHKPVQPAKLRSTMRQLLQAAV